MKFKQYLTEANTFDKFLNDVKSDCSDFLKDTDKPLWRGVRKSNTFGVDEANENRKPKDSAHDLFFNNCFNLGIEQISNVPLIRTKALFCTSGFSQTAIYGPPHFIFPSNGCNYIFSNIVYDSYEDIHFGKHEFDIAFNNDWLNDTNLFNRIPNLTIEGCFEWAKEDGYDKKIVEKTTHDLGEMLRLDFNYDISSDVGDATDNKVTHEILCYGAKKYYRINVDFLRKQLKMKDDNSAVFYQTLYTRLLEKINA